MSAAAGRYYRRGMRSLAAGDASAAVEQLGAACDLAPAQVAARLAYAVALARLGDVARAGRVLRAGLARSPAEAAAAPLWIALGEVLTLAGDFAAAEDAFAQAGRISGWERRASIGRSRVFAKLGRYDRAFAALSRAARDG